MSGTHGWSTKDKYTNGQSVVYYRIPDLFEDILKEKEKRKKGKTIYFKGVYLE